ncbi:COG1470 family protein [Streptomyces pinistramenti]|uniref:COG1470 family protein n=1 Tax=Streptomyces pinistramenti TaxID=2884812 RepID=UPI001D07B090|nr:hypothetical protein [Streptomyces pinistramenti]MCB5907531.1 hypothetical protein [Streptomyces pinistramenti]
MPFRSRARVTGAVLAAAAVLLCPARSWADPVPDAPPGAAVTAAPAAGSGTGAGDRGRTYFYLEGGPGTVMKDRLALTNPADRARTVRLHGADTGAWLVPAAKEVRIPARTRATVPFTVTVPGDATPGDHSGTLIAEDGGRKMSVRIHLRVTGPALSALTVENVSVTGRGDTTVIHYALVNRGTTVLTPRLAVRADGVFGPVLRRAARTLPVRLSPGQRVERTETWPDPPALDAVDVRLTATAGGGAHGTAEARYTPVPRGPLGGAALVLVAGAGGWAVRRGRRRRAAAAAAVAHSEDGDGVRDVMSVGAPS